MESDQNSLQFTIFSGRNRASAHLLAIETFPKYLEVNACLLNPDSERSYLILRVYKSEAKKNTESDFL